MGIPQATTRFSAALSDVDSFDDDLAWILERLTERAGGQFGLFIRYIDGEQESPILARCVRDSALDEAGSRRIATALRWDRLPDRQSPQTVLFEQTLDDPAGAEQLRLVHLRFTLTQGVTIVAVVGKHASSLSFLQAMVARRLHPVLERYLNLWWMHRKERRRAQALAAAMDQNELAIVLLDRRSRIVFCNTNAERLLTESDGLRRMGDCIGCGGGGDVLKFQTALQHALLTNAQSRTAATFKAPFVALHRPGRRALLAWATPVIRTAVDPDDPAVVVHVLDPESNVARQLAPAHRVYRLTPTEGRLVSRLVEGLSLAEAAGAMQIGVATARGYLKNVFTKTGTNRQSELLRVMIASTIRADIGIDLTLL